MEQCGRDLFVAKFSSTGDELWRRQAGSSSFDVAHGIAFDSEGAVYVVGLSNGSFLGTHPSAGSQDVVLLKYDAAGTLIWSRQFGSSAIDIAHAVAVDAFDNIYVTGYTGGALGGPLAGRFDAFLAKYTVSGGQVWIRQFGTPESDIGYAVATGRNGAIYLCGSTGGNLGGTVAGGGADPFVSKFNGAGEQNWTQQITTPVFDEAQALATGVWNETVGDALYIAGVDWESAGIDATLTALSAPDTDGDGLLDSWEIDGIPYTDASGVEQHFLLPGADPMHKDLYVEVDAMEGFSLSDAAISLLEAAFDNAPLENPDGVNGIRLHILKDESNLPALALWATEGCWPADFDDWRSLFYGTVEEQIHPHGPALRKAKDVDLVAFQGAVLHAGKQVDIINRLDPNR